MAGTFPTTLPTSLPPRPATFHGYSGFGQPPHAGGVYASPSGVISQTGGIPFKFGEWTRLFLVLDSRAKSSDLKYSSRVATKTGLASASWCSCSSGNTEGATYERGSRKTEIGKEIRD